MVPNKSLDCVFFDIGDTLGTLDQGTGQLVPFPDTVGLLTAIHQVLGLRIGIITTLGSRTNSQGHDLLKQAGLDSFVDPQAFISEHDANGEAKPHPAIYRLAAKKAGVPIERCLFVGESMLEVIGALAPGMPAVLRARLSG